MSEEALERKQEHLRAQQEKERQNADLRVLITDLLNIRERLEVSEIIGTRTGYPGNARLLMMLIEQWVRHIQQNRKVGRNLF